MKDPKLTAGFIVAFFILTAISAAALKPNGGGYRLLHPEEAATVRGGGQIAAGLGISPRTGGSSSQGEDIVLKNVPYATQYLNPSNWTRQGEAVRSEKYCGIASAVMVRAKSTKNSSIASALYDTFTGYNYFQVESAMKTIDNHLLNGRYGGLLKYVDVKANDGLLYIGGRSDSAESQYNVTKDILQGVYTGKLGSTGIADSVSWTQRVTSVSMRPISAGLKGGTREISDATKAIWDHIKNYRQPVVVVVDSNKQVPGNGNIVSSWIKPTLHYVVIRGIYENGSGSTRYFSVYDPGDTIRYPIEYSEADLRTLMALPPNTPAWVYQYGNQQAGSYPAYILTVQGD